MLEKTFDKLNSSPHNRLLSACKNKKLFPVSVNLHRSGCNYSIYVTSFAFNLRKINMLIFIMSPSFWGLSTYFNHHLPHPLT